METVAAHETVGRIRRIAILLSVTLFFAACVTPALELRSYPATFGPVGPEQPKPKFEAAWGYYLLLQGWLSLRFPLLAWLANVTLILGWIALALRWWRATVLPTVASLVFATDLLRLVSGGTEPLGLLDVRHYFIERPLIGRYFWTAGMVATGVGAMRCWRGRRSPREAVPLLLALGILLGGAVGWHRYARPFEPWPRTKELPALQQRVRSAHSVGGGAGDADIPSPSSLHVPRNRMPNAPAPRDPLRVNSPKNVTEQAGGRMAPSSVDVTGAGPGAGRPPFY